jgi:hypothetical protein
MKKIIQLLLIIAMTLSVSACGNTTPGGNDNPQPEITGKVVDAGRFSVLVPEGWSFIDLGEYSDGSSAVLLKGTQEDWMKVPQLSIIYLLPVDIAISAAAFFDDVIQKPDFDLGDYHWKHWTGTNQGLKSIVAESEGDYGFVSVSLQQIEEGGEIFSMDDPEVQAIIKSLKLEPTTEVSWVKLIDGQVTAELPGVDGYYWEDTGTMAADGVEAAFAIEGNTVSITPQEGSGVYRLNLRLANEEASQQMGEAFIALRMADSKFDALYDAKNKIFSEPEDIGGGEWEDTTDYEAIDAVIKGAWIDSANGLTMFIQPYAELEHGYQITIKSASQTITAFGQIEPDNMLHYYEVSLNGGANELSIGWFMIDGDYLIWGNDDVVGQYENSTIFVKA